MSVIISAHLSILNSYENHARHCELLLALDKLGKSYSGVFVMKNGKKVSAFLVQSKLNKKLLELAKSFQQRSVTVIEDGKLYETLVNNPESSTVHEKLVRTLEKNAKIIVSEGSLTSYFGTEPLESAIQFEVTA